MNFRLTAVLFSSIFVLGLVLLIMSLTGGTKPSTDAITEELAVSKPDQIDTIEFEREGGLKLKLVRDSAHKDQWQIVEPFKAKADTVAVSEVVGALLKAKPTTYGGSMPNMATAGLQPAGLKVTLRHGEKSSTINLGNVTPGGKGVVFVTTSARPKRPMAIPRTSLESILREPNKDGAAADLAKWTGDFRSKAVFDVDPRGAGDDVIGITLKTKNGTKTLSLVQSPRGWKFADPTGWGDADPAGDTAASPGTFTGVRPLLGALTSLQAISAGDFIENPTPQDLEKYGLNPSNPDRVEVRITNKNKVETVAFIGKKDAAAPPPKDPHGAMPQTGKWWVQVQGQPGVIRANAGDLSGLVSVIENPDPLRDRNLLSVEKTRIDGLDLANGAVKLRKIGGPLAPWKLYGNPAAGDPQVATLVDVERILNGLTERRTVKSFPAPNEANFGPGAVTVKVWTDGFEANPDAKAEPKEKGKPITLVFGKVEGDLVNVKRLLPDGATDFFLLPTMIKLGSSPDPVDILQAANKPRLDFLDKDLKGFSSTNVDKLTVQGVVNFDLLRDDTANPSAGGPVFRFAADARGPAGQVYKKGEQADSQAVQGLLDILATTPSVNRFVDEAPTPEKLVEYGLGTATKLRVIVGLKGTAPDDKERVYEFGKETADPNFVYAQVGGKKAVFTLPKFIYDKFPNADLRNKIVFQVNPAEVSRIEIVGWGHVFGKPGTLTLEKNKEGIWVATKAPTTGYVADPNRVAAFLKMLESLQVRSFTGDNTMEPKHKLGDDKELFVVTLANAAGGHHLHLRLGGPADANGTTLYAFTNRVPDGKPIVTVDAAPFKPYKEGPAAFAK